MMVHCEKLHLDIEGFLNWVEPFKKRFLLPCQCIPSVFLQTKVALYALLHSFEQSD